MLRTALIALALALAACASQHPQNPPPPAQAGKNSDMPRFLASPNANTPVAITCGISVRGAPPGTIISVPAGKKPTDFCPVTAITYKPPVISGLPAPVSYEDKTSEQPP